MHDQRTITRELLEGIESLKGLYVYSTHFDRQLSIFSAFQILTGSKVRNINLGARAWIIGERAI